MGYSQKHLIKIFKDHVGLTPKSFLKVVRFQRAVQDIEKRGRINWSAVALDAGYFDQSHFIADFRAFSGYTPENYLLRRGQHLNYIPQIDLR